MELKLYAFLILGILASWTGLMAMTRKWPVSSAILLISFMILLAGMYGLMGAHFSAGAQIIVYAGAIMVVFIFVIMLLNLHPDELRFGKMTFFEIGISALSTGVALALGTEIGLGAVARSLATVSMTGSRKPFYPDEENFKNVSALMFTDYLWAFWMASFLILAAIIGAIVIARKRSDDARD